MLPGSHEKGWETALQDTNLREEQGENVLQVPEQRFLYSCCRTSWWSRYADCSPWRTPLTVQVVFFPKELEPMESPWWSRYILMDCGPSSHWSGGKIQGAWLQWVEVGCCLEHPTWCLEHWLEIQALYNPRSDSCRAPDVFHCEINNIL